MYKDPGGLDPDTSAWNPTLETQATQALISIANSLAILADETKTVSPIVAAAMFNYDDDDDEPTQPFVRKPPSGAS